MFAALTLFASFGVAAAEWPADPKADPCDAGSAYGQGECAQRRLDLGTKDMAAVYDALMTLLPADHDEYQARSRLIEAQATWLRYRDASCSFEGGISGGVTMWQSTRTVYCEAAATRDRVAQLRAYLACAKDEADACDAFM